MQMRVTFDPVKNAKNVAERGLPFEWVADPAWETALLQEDRRRDYGEIRVRVLARLGDRLHVAVMTMRGDAVHVISFRKANRKEVAWYEQERG
jgi:uncharacterized DUF497 family protein